MALEAARHTARRPAGSPPWKIRALNDIIWAHMEGTVMRVRPKLMTVSTMLIGLVPLLWSTGSGSDVMKRIAAPMVGGLITSSFLTLEIIPVVYTYWRQEQLPWELLPAHDSASLQRMRWLAHMHGAGWARLAALVASALCGACRTLARRDSDRRGSSRRSQRAFLLAARRRSMSLGLAVALA